MQKLDIGVVVFVVAIIALVFYATAIEQQQWDAFSVAHHCMPVAHTQSKSATAILSDGGVGSVTIPATTTYACDDGQQYTRNN